jgi:hypothetical protein
MSSTTNFITQAARRGIVVEICFFNGRYDDTWPLSLLGRKTKANPAPTVRRRRVSP